nr:hypothetical protein Itr_chr09CG11050 [Ipomoea trifida]GLL43916.1 hypothetical protein Itr_chr13CG05030 [Ipomoea trifida]
MYNPSYIFPKEAKKRSHSHPPSASAFPQSTTDHRRGTAEVAPPPLRLRPLPSAFRLPSASRNRRPTDRSSTAEASVFALCHPPSDFPLLLSINDRRTEAALPRDRSSTTSPSAFTHRFRPK